MKSSGVGKILLWPGGSLWIGKAGAPTSAHAHHAVQVTLGLDGMVRFRDSASGTWGSYRGALIASNHAHAFDGEGRLIAHIFIEPESRDGRILWMLTRDESILSLNVDQLEAAAEQLKSAYVSGCGAEHLISAARKVVSGLTDGCEPPKDVDPRIGKSLIEIAKRLNRPITLVDAAASVHLSPSRYRHLFIQETGLTFRAYVLWLRMKRVVELMAAGESLTAAAHTAGFSDSAHLSRTFRRMFGIAPASLQGN